MSTFGLTADGLVIKRQADIKAELQAAYRSVFGPAINLDDRSPLGQIIGVHSEREADIWELVEVVYNSRFPDTATGLSLDNVATITNVTRMAATYSEVTGRVSGDNGTVVPVGFIASVAGNKTARFVTTESGTISGGYVDLAFQAESTGPVEAPVGTLTVVETPVSGVTAVNNSTEAIVGRAVETDSELRIRRLRVLARAGTATVNGIRNAVLAVADVSQCMVIENASGTTDGDGRPPYSFETVALGGTDQAIGDAIFSAKPAGIETYGSTSVTVVDSQKISHTINFSRPTQVPINVEISVHPNTDPDEGDIYPSNGDDLIKAAILAYTEANYYMGHDVIISQFYTPVNTVAGVLSISIRISDDGGSTWQSTNLAISANEIATFDTSRMTVIHV